MHFSRRSGWLILWGIAWVAYGLAVHDAPQAASLPLYATVPTAWQGIAWVGVGVVSILSALVPRFPRTVGFALAVIPPLLWALGFLLFWIQTAREAGWQGMIVWGAISVAVVMSSRDAEVRGRP